ncbi:hypothetical protein EW145_g8051 [Phellinidium pouzarii]|uniref:Uncharacterized protein n=1 Tax=Phellinidium pouzarii TaxID=167371 RepID=A0A4S4KAH4_9AGAM|nr:hypothetical protein EW145_g8051 [Phellinidium pouzarii]
MSKSVSRRTDSPAPISSSELAIGSPTPVSSSSLTANVEKEVTSSLEAEASICRGESQSTDSDLVLGKTPLSSCERKETPNGSICEYITCVEPSMLACVEGEIEDDDTDEDEDKVADTTIGGLSPCASIVQYRDLRRSAAPSPSPQRSKDGKRLREDDTESESESVDGDGNPPTKRYRSAAIENIFIRVVPATPTPIRTLSSNPTTLLRYDEHDGDGKGNDEDDEEM